MNLMDMVNGLNRMDDMQPFSPGAFLLAVKMIDLLNGLYWPDTVGIDTNRMSVMAKCSSRNATLNARNELIDRGVLEVVSKGKKGSPSIYRLADLSGFCSRNQPNHEPNIQYGMKNEPNQGWNRYRIGTEYGTESGPNHEPNHGHINRQDKDKTRQDKNDHYDGSGGGDPLTLSLEDIRNGRELRETIEAEAARVGLPCHDAQINLAVDLAQVHGLDNLLDAIRITGNGPTIAWRYVKGVLERGVTNNVGTSRRSGPVSWSKGEDSGARGCVYGITDGLV